MTSREIVQRTLDFDNPERVARSFGDSDFAGAGCRPKTHLTDWGEIGGGRWEMTDHWGNIWQRVDATSKGEVVRGVLEELSDMSSYEFPDYSRGEDYDAARKAREENPDKWLTGWMPGFAFNIARKMRTLEQYMIDIITDRDRMRELHDRIDEVIEHMIRNYADAGVDAVTFPEDWGTQNATLISPGLWYEEFFPRFEKLCGLAHGLGMRVFMHSCGRIGAIVPGMIEAGIDVFQFDQPDLHGIDNLAAYQEKSKVTFWCPVDIQHVLPLRDEKIIRDKAREMLDKLWRGRGGFIAGWYTDNESLNLESCWQEYACDEFVEHRPRSHQE
ncbi:uroporphyrinogen decarboxylase family protein [Candidatus Hydrogenedentota bacterium]